MNQTFRKITPNSGASWYVKWTASVFIITSMSMRGIDGLQFYDLLLSTVGVSGWLWVGILWKDRALILLNGIGLALLLRTLLQTLYI